MFYGFCGETEIGYGGRLEYALTQVGKSINPSSTDIVTMFHDESTVEYDDVMMWWYGEVVEV